MPTDLDYIKNLVKTLELGDNTLEVHDVLQGGVVSVVASGTYTKDGEQIPVAIKHTKEKITPGPKFCYHDIKDFLSNAYASQSLDAQILTDLQEESEIIVPEIIEYFEKANITLLRNFNPDGFSLLQDALISGQKLEDKVFENIGATLANLNQFTSKNSAKYKSVEKSEMQMEQRFVELMTSLYDGRMDYFNTLWDDIHNSESKGFGWPDGHPKNIAIKSDGTVMIFDFGRSIEFDLDYVLPNFLAHILLFTLSGAIELETGMNYTKKTIEAFEKTTKKFNSEYEIDERKFVWYTVAEIAHRGKTMRWIDPAAIQLSDNREVDIPRVKAAVDQLIDTVFAPSEAIENTNDFFSVLRQLAIALKEDGGYYQRPNIEI